MDAGRVDERSREVLRTRDLPMDANSTPRKTVNRDKGRFCMIDILLALALVLGSIGHLPNRPEPAGGLPIPQHDTGVKNAK